MAEELKESGTVTATSVVGFVFGLIGMLGSFVPCLGAAAFYISIPAAIISGIALGIAYSQNAKRTFAIVAVTISLIGVVVSGVQFFSIISEERKVQRSIDNMREQFSGKPTDKTNQLFPSNPITTQAPKQIIEPWYTSPVNAPYSRIKNKWKPDQFINIETGNIQSTPIEPGWASAKWIIERIEGTPYSRIKNGWKPDQFINIEAGNIQSTPILSGWDSAQWIIERIPRTPYSRIMNKWKPYHFINIETGTIQCTPIRSGWDSAQWIIE